MHLHYKAILVIGSICLALAAIFVRLQVAKKPASVMKIIMPPIGMSTGFFMFLVPEMRIPVSWGIISFLAGAVFLAYPLIVTSKFHVIDGNIYLKRSKAFIWILLTLLAIRIILHNYIQHYISLAQTGAVFFILAFGMLLPWRIAMYYGYRKVEKSIPPDDDSIDDKNMIIES